MKIRRLVFYARQERFSSGMKIIQVLKSSTVNLEKICQRWTDYDTCHLILSAEMYGRYKFEFCSLPLHRLALYVGNSLKVMTRMKILAYVTRMKILVKYISIYHVHVLRVIEVYTWYIPQAGIYSTD